MASTTFRFVHAADLHLDVPFEGLRRASPVVTHELSQAPLKAWDALVHLTIDQNAAFLLLAGGICGGAERAVWAQVRFLRGLERLAARGIRTFIVRGHEDPTDQWPAIPQWPDGVHCFGSRDVESVVVRMGGNEGATIHGISHASGQAVEPVPRFTRTPESGLHIGLLDARVGNASTGDRCSTDELRKAGMDYWALGRDHRHRTLSDGSPWIVYPGTPQGRSLDGHEIGPKGAVVVTVEHGAISDAQLHPLDSIRLILAEVDASALTDASRAREALLEVAGQVSRENGGHAVVARAVVHGSRDASSAHLTDDLFAGLLEELRQVETGHGSFVWWDSIVDATETVEVQDEDAFSEHVRRLVRAWTRMPADLDRLLTEQGLALSGPAAPAGPTALDSIEHHALLARAERVVLGLTGREQP